MSDAIYDSPILGAVVDQIDSDQDQCDLNSKLLIEHNKNVILNSITKRISKYYLNYLIKNIEIPDRDYWKNVLKVIVHHYSLVFIRNYIDEVFFINNFESECIKLLVFLKVKMIDLILDKKIEKGRIYTPEEFYNLLQNIKTPVIMLETIKYIDSVSLEKFLKKIYLESEMFYNE